MCHISVSDPLFCFVWSEFSASHDGLPSGFCFTLVFFPLALCLLSVSLFFSPHSFYHSISVSSVSLSSPPPVHSSPVTPSFSSISSLSIPTASPSVSPPHTHTLCSPIHSLIMCFNVDSCSCREQLSHCCVQMKLFRSALAGTNGAEHKLLHLFYIIFLLYFCKLAQVYQGNYVSFLLQEK